MSTPPLHHFALVRFVPSNNEHTPRITSYNVCYTKLLRTYDLVKEYNQFYHDYSILREENADVKLFRLVLSANVAKVIRLGMGLLGIDVPNRM